MGPVNLWRLGLVWMPQSRRSTVVNGVPKEGASSWGVPAQLAQAFPGLRVRAVLEWGDCPITAPAWAARDAAHALV